MVKYLKKTTVLLLAVLFLTSCAGFAVKSRQVLHTSKVGFEETRRQVAAAYLDNKIDRVQIDYFEIKYNQPITKLHNTATDALLVYEAAQRLKDNDLAKSKMAEIAKAREDIIKLTAEAISTARSWGVWK